MEVREKDGDSESIYMNVEDAEKTSNQSEIYENIYLNRTTEIPGKKKKSKFMYTVHLKHTPHAVQPSCESKFKNNLILY